MIRERKDKKSKNKLFYYYIRATLSGYFLNIFYLKTYRTLSSPKGEHLTITAN